METRMPCSLVCTALARFCCVALVVGVALVGCGDDDDVTAIDASTDDAGTRDAGSDLARADAGDCIDDDGDDACTDFDCDDDDARRFPGNAEVCDAEALDEDCNDSTLGDLDADADGVVSSACCNGTRCGADCDDMNAAIALSFVDGPPAGCDGIDNDCSGDVDPGCVCSGSITRVCGASDVGACSFGVETCTSGDWGACLGAVDALPTDLCNGDDDDCDGETDEGFPCAVGQARACTTASFLDGSQVCLPDCSRYAPCRITSDEGPTLPATCNGLDDDDDGRIDENFECRRGSSRSCTTACGVASTQTCGTTCVWGACRVATEICNYCDDNGVSAYDDEISFAVAMSTDRWSCASPMRYVDRAAMCVSTTTSGTRSDEITVIDAAGGRGVGAVWLSEALHLGWGTIDVEVEVRATYCDRRSADGGWALVLAQSGSGDVGTPETRGVPFTRYGMAAVWNFKTRPDPRSELRTNFDTVELFKLSNAGAFSGYRGGRDNTGVGVPAASALDGAGPGGACVTRVQRLFITYTPQDPSVAGNEERIQVRLAPGGPTLMDYAHDTAPSDIDIYLSDDLLAGRPLSIGVTAGNETAVGAATVKVRVQSVTASVSSFQTTALRRRICP